MCRKIDCVLCGKPTWKGCGQHIESALEGIGEEDRCSNWLFGESCRSLTKQGIAPDGSCLFASIGFLTTGGTLPDNSCHELREECAGHILAQPSVFTELLLGKPLEDYLTFIRSPHEYGGENEIRILAELRNVNICVVSCVPFQPVYALTYSPPAGTAETSIYILYNGQHYDAIVGGGLARNIYAFAAADVKEEEAKLLALEFKTAREAELKTRIRKRIQCSCGTIVENAAAFQVHCETVEHDADFAYDCLEIEVVEEVASASDD